MAEAHERASEERSLGRLRALGYSGRGGSGRPYRARRAQPLLDRLDQLHPVEQALDVIEPIRLDHERGRKVIPRVPGLVQTLERGEIAPRDLLLEVAAPAADPPGERLQRAAEVDHQVG